MKKFLKRFLLFFCLPLTLLAVFVFGSIAYVRYYDHFTESRKAKSSHLSFLYNDSEADVIDDINDKLDSRYERVLKDLKQEKEMSLEWHIIMLHPDLNSFQSKMMGLPWWLADICKGFGMTIDDRNPKYVGATDNDGFIRIVSPSNPGNSGYTYDQILDVAVHELTRKVIGRISDSRLPFTGFGNMLIEGLSIYESGQGYMYEKDDSFDSQVLKVLPESIDKNSVSGGNICVAGYSFVKYVIDNYGYDKIIELLKKDYTNNNYDTQTRALYDEWVDYLKANQN